MRDWRGRKRQESIPNSNSILILFIFYSQSIYILFTICSHFIHILFTFYSNSFQVLLIFDWFQCYSNSIPILFQCYSNAIPILLHFYHIQTLFAFHLHFFLFLKALVCDHVQVAHTNCTSRYRSNPHHTHMCLLSGCTSQYTLKQ